MNRSIMSAGVAAALAAVCALSMLALAALYAFAPELRDDQTAAANALSKSAIGFAGLKELLEQAGIPVSVYRGAAAGDVVPSLTILTPPADVTGAQLMAFRARGPVLIVLDKWEAVPSPVNAAWVMKLGLAPTALMMKQVGEVLGTVSVLRTPRGAGAPAISAVPAGAFAARGFAMPRLGGIDNPQTILGGKALVTAGAYGSLLVQNWRKDRPVYVLADPDVLNNHGLADEANARAALAIVAALRQGEGPVRLDVTLNGLARTQNMLRVLFLPPFLGATLCALIAALLMGLHTAIRFGAPLLPERAFARGKKALADNSADLVRIMGREGAMAARYVAAARGLVLDRLGARRAPPAQQDELLAVLERGGISFAALQSEAAQAQGGADLLRIARKTYDWRRRISGE